MWAEAVAEYELHPTAHLPLLIAALEARDRATEARKEIQKNGLLWVNAKTGAQHASPMLKVERDSLREFRLTWAQLGMEVE